MTSMSSRRAVSPLVVCLVAASILGLSGYCEAQVVSLDPDYTASLLAHGVQVPDGGMMYRSETNDFLVTEEFSAHVRTVNASTGSIGLFADLSRFRPGALLDHLAINSVGDV